MGDTMDITKALRNYVMENEFKIGIVKDKVNIVNYTSVGHFDSSKIIIRHDTGNVIIKGTNLVVSKLLHDEILITGKIVHIELG